MSDWKHSYFDYLTKRLDSGESKNIVVPVVSNLVQKRLKTKDRVKVLDVGCFSGAMLNRIYLNLPQRLKTKVSLVGVDVDKKVMQRGANKYKNIVFVYSDLEKELPFVKQYDITILSNVLHELYPSEKLNARKKLIGRTFSRLAQFMNTGGQIVILDGVRPDDSKQKITVELVNDSKVNDFLYFAKEYKAFKVKARKVSSLKIQTDVLSLAAYFTKARYVHESYWENEASQLYQLFDASEFRKMITRSGLTCLEISPQQNDGQKIRQEIKSVFPKIKYPAKNVLIVAQKTD